MKKMFIMLVLGITLLNTRIYIEDYDISHFKENEICVSIFNKDIFLVLILVFMLVFVTPSHCEIT